jgi:hypothetical protein
MHSGYLTQTLAREHQAQMRADAESRRLARSFRPAREPRVVSRRIAAALLRLAHRFDPSLVGARPDPRPAAH